MNFGFSQRLYYLLYEVVCVCVLYEVYEVVWCVCASVLACMWRPEFNVICSPGACFLIQGLPLSLGACRLESSD